MAENTDHNHSYRRQSFDRFGDDLTEVIVDYLSFGDKFRYECVGRQFRRTIFAKHRVLTIDGKLVDKLGVRGLASGCCGGDSNGNDGGDGDDGDGKIHLRRFETVLRKCPHIERVVVSGDGGAVDDQTMNAMIDLIGQQLPRLRSIDMQQWRNVSTETIGKFMDRCSGRLRSFAFVKPSNVSANRSLLTALTKTTSAAADCLEEIDIVSHNRNNVFNQLFRSSTSSSPSVIFKRLRSLHFKYSSNETKYFAQHFAADTAAAAAGDSGYGRQLRSLDVTVSRSCDERAMETLVTGLTRMTRLVDLQIISDSQVAIGSDQLKRIGDHCGRQLKRLSLNQIVLSTDLMTRIIETISGPRFYRLTRLQLSGYFDKDFAVGCQSFGQLKRLTHFTLISYYGYRFRHQFFDNCHQCWPRLEAIKLFDIQITDSLMKSVSNLPNLKSLELNGNENYGQKSMDCLVRNCRKITKISINNCPKLL